METSDTKPTSTSAKTEPPISSDGDGKLTSVTRPKMLLKLKSMNGANISVQGLMPHDETPTPTKMLAKASMEGLFEQISQNGETKSASTEQTPPKVDNPFDKQFKESITPDPTTGSNAVEPNAEKDVTEIPSDDNNDESMTNPAANVGREVTVNSEQPTTQSEPDRKSPKPQFKRPTDLPVPKDGQIPVATMATSMATTSQHVNMVQQQMPMLVLSGMNGQMAQQIQSPTRLVMAQADMFNGQNGQGKYVVLQQPQARVLANNILVPSSNSSTPMILTSPMSTMGGQIVMQLPQVMQIQDPQTGAISNVITQSPQQQMVTMVQPMDANQLQLRQQNHQSNNQSAPPPYTQCVMAVSPSIQFVSPQQYQMVPTNQSMLVNPQNGGQVQIINHGQIANNGQVIQTTMMNGQQAVQAGPVVQTQSRSSTISNDGSESKMSGGTMDESGPIALQDDMDDDMDDDSPHRVGYARPSYTHRPSQIGLNNVVQLSKESLRAIEQAGVECGAGKRGGPRLNYDELDPKRRRFLERNRQAAARCRERKKQWIVSLEGRANELKAENQGVEDDIIRLKSKLDQLRGALEMQRQRHANGIDKENNLQIVNSVDLTTTAKPLTADETGSMNESLKTETAVTES